MSQLIHEHTARVRGEDGTEYRVITYGERRNDGPWEAQLTLRRRSNRFAATAAARVRV